MPLPKLDNWESTQSALHEVALVVGALRVASSDPLTNDMHYSLNVIRGGVSTNELKVGGELIFDFATFTLTYMRDEHASFTIHATGYNQQSLMQAVLDEFKRLGIELEPSMKLITSDKPFEVDMTIAGDYANLVDAVYTMLARFKAKLRGFMSPLVIWPHHFDIAFIWFATNSINEHKDPHMAFGFAPFSDGIDRPYFYAYGWSQTTGYVEVDVKSPAKAVTEGYTGLCADYDVLNTDDNMTQVVEQILLTHYKNVAKVLQ